MFLLVLHITNTAIVLQQLLAIFGMEKKTCHFYQFSHYKEFGA